MEGAVERLGLVTSEKSWPRPWKLSSRPCNVQSLSEGRRHILSKNVISRSVRVCNVVIISTLSSGLVHTVWARVILIEEYEVRLWVINTCCQSETFAIVSSNLICPLCPHQWQPALWAPSCGRACAWHRLCQPQQRRWCITHTHTHTHVNTCSTCTLYTVYTFVTSLWDLFLLFSPVNVPLIV